jgi:parallel beta-helix repeat protein
MKSSRKTKTIILIIFGILFSPLFINNPKFNAKNRYITSNYNDFINLKLSAISGKIHINNNWSAAKTAGICTGLGTSSNPYIIEDLIIDGGDSGSCILIENSNVYFKIENCSLLNSGGTGWDDGEYAYAGIELENVRNGDLTNNNCSNNFVGILAKDCYNIQVLDNYVNNNDEFGILIWNVNNSDIYANIIRYNPQGLGLDESNHNTLSDNIFEFNFVGLAIAFHSNYNILTGNNITSNDIGVQFHTSKCNTLINNIYSNNGVDIDGTQENCEIDGEFPFTITLIIIIVIICIVILTIMGGVLYRRRKIKFKSEIKLKKKDVEKLREIKTLEKQDKEETLPLEPIQSIKTEEVELIPPVLEGRVDEPIMEAPVELPTEVEHTASVPEQRKEKVEDISFYCKFCGMGLTNKAKFCPQCGTSIT